VSAPNDGRVSGRAGHTGNSEKASPSASTARIGAGALRNPGTGRNATTPLTRVSTSRNASIVLTGNPRVMSVREPAEVAEQRRGIGNHFAEHPRHRQHQRGEKRRQPRNGVEAGILNRSENLNQAHHHANHESYRQYRQT